MLTHLIKQTQDLILRRPSYDGEHLRNIEGLLTDINESLDSTSFKGVIGRWNSLKETTGIKMLYKAYQDISQNILEQFNKINDDFKVNPSNRNNSKVNLFTHGSLISSLRGKIDLSIQ